LPRRKRRPKQRPRSPWGFGGAGFAGGSDNAGGSKYAGGSNAGAGDSKYAGGSYGGAGGNKSGGNWGSGGSWASRGGGGGGGGGWRNTGGGWARGSVAAETKWGRWPRDKMEHATKEDAPKEDATKEDATKEDAAKEDGAKDDDVVQEPLPKQCKRGSSAAPAAIADVDEDYVQRRRARRAEADRVPIAVPVCIVSLFLGIGACRWHVSVSAIQFALVRAMLAVLVRHKYDTDVRRHKDGSVNMAAVQKQTGMDDQLMKAAFKQDGGERIETAHGRGRAKRKVWFEGLGVDANDLEDEMKETAEMLDRFKRPSPERNDRIKKAKVRKILRPRGRH